MNLKACLNFARVRFESFFFEDIFLFLEEDNGLSDEGKQEKRPERKRKNDLIIFFCRKIKTGS